MGAETFKIYTVDIVVFLVFVAAVVTVGLLKSKTEGSSENYFLAGRGLKWWLIGFSLIAANISTEQFVGMSGNAASHVGMAIASYEWMAAITLVVVAFGFLPYFLRAGIYTMPEFLEYRFTAGARTFMAVATVLIYVLLVGAVTYSGALTITSLTAKAGYSLTLFEASLIIGVIAMVYVTAGGLKACAWADLIQGSALVLGGAVIMYFAFQKLGQANEAAMVVSAQTGAVAVKSLAPDASTIDRFIELNHSRMNMFLPSTDSVLPWTALLLGLWIPNFYYWGLNQYITQRTLGSASLSQGQKGIVFAAFMKLLIPFVIVIPGIIAFNLYSKQMQLAAVSDTAVSVSKYYKINPQTKFVEVAQQPDENTIAKWQPGRYLIAIYPDENSLKNVKVTNPYVLPITKSAFDQISPSTLTIFTTEDHSWRSVNQGLAEEIDRFNEKVKEAAKTSGKLPDVEKLIAFKYDTALAQLLGNVLPRGSGLVGFVIAALLGAVVSSLAAMLNAASTIFAMDIYKKHISPGASAISVVRVGRVAVVVFAAIAVFLAPQLGNPKISNSIFTIIQESQGFISPGILAAFAFGLIVRRAPPVCGITSLLTNLVAYGVLKLTVPSLQFLNRMAVCFALCVLLMTIITLVKPLPQPIEFKQRINIELKSSKTAAVAGIVVVILTLILYVIFSPLVAAK